MGSLAPSAPRHLHLLPTHPGCPRRHQWPPPQSQPTCRQHRPPARVPRPAPSDCRTRFPPSPRRDCGGGRGTQGGAEGRHLAGDTQLGRQEGCCKVRRECPEPSPAPDVLATPSDGDGVRARDSGVVFETICTITQVLLLHPLLALCQDMRALGLPSSSPIGCPPPPSPRPTYWGPSQ